MIVSNRGNLEILINQGKKDVGSDIQRFLAAYFDNKL